MKNVYILKAGEDKYKIGIAANVRKRVSSIQTGCPWPVSIVTTKLVENAEEVERSLHALFSKQSSGGGTEWFTLTPDMAVSACIHLHSTPEPETLQWDVAFSQAMQASNKTLAIVDDFIRRIDKEKQSAPSPEQEFDSPARDTVDSDVAALALSVFRRWGRVSTSLLQRELKIGYGRAARIVDQLEDAGYVGPYNGNSPRILLCETPPIEEIQKTLDVA